MKDNTINDLAKALNVLVENGILTLPIELTISENPLTSKLVIEYWDWNNDQYVELTLENYLK